MNASESPLDILRKCEDSGSIDAAFKQLVRRVFADRRCGVRTARRGELHAGKRICEFWREENASLYIWTT